MNKKSFILIILTILSISSVNAASRYNEPGEDSTKYVTAGHFVLREVRADRAMRSNYLDTEQEDHWKIWYHFSVYVTNVKLVWYAMDGTNDMDTRKYTDTWDARSQNKEYSKEHKNFPTYVDNMELTITYRYNGQDYTQQLVIYSLGKADKGSNDLDVVIVDLAAGQTSKEAIPNGSVDTDGNGQMSGVKDTVNKVNPIDDVIAMIKGPYNFFKWITSEETMLSFGLGIGITLVGAYLMIAIPKPSVIFSSLLLLFIGIILLVGTILEGIQAIGF